MLHNMSMMARPMHLHGHAFQVVSTGGTRFAGAVRDTVHVPPMGKVTLAVDAALPTHAPPFDGMMTESAVSA